MFDREREGKVTEIKVLYTNEREDSLMGAFIDAIGDIARDPTSMRQFSSFPVVGKSESGEVFTGEQSFNSPGKGQFVRAYTLLGCSQAHGWHVAKLNSVDKTVRPIGQKELEEMGRDAISYMLTMMYVYLSA